MSEDNFTDVRRVSGFPPLESPKFQFTHVPESSFKNIDCDRIPLIHCSVYSDYQNEYHRSVGDLIHFDFLKVTLDDRVAVLGRIRDFSQTNWDLGTPNRVLELGDLLFDSKIPDNQKASLITNSAEVLMNSDLGAQTATKIMVTLNLSEGVAPLLVESPYFKATSISAELRVDLGKSEEELFASLRKKHRQQISKYRKLTHVSVRTDVESLDELRNLHYKVAGRKTRSRLTWKIQEDALLQGLAFVVSIRNLSNELLGALYVMHWQKEAISFSAAYDRSAMAKGYPLGHICEWEAIRFLSRRKLAKSYLLGTASMEASEDTKLRNIYTFKDGFSPTYHLIGHLEYVGGT